LKLIYSDTFLRASKKIIARHQGAAADIRQSLVDLSEDPFLPHLRSHKLKGKLKHSWACSAGYDLRIVFRFVTHEGEKSILLESIGTHEEVY
jgi:mRNA-degrading endonuclease YafQ of YafQ-DinJ toxin-antitoxin module